MNVSALISSLYGDRYRRAGGWKQNLDITNAVQLVVLPKNTFCPRVKPQARGGISGAAESR